MLRNTATNNYMLLQMINQLKDSHKLVVLDFLTKPTDFQYWTEQIMNIFKTYQSSIIICQGFRTSISLDVAPYLTPEFMEMCNGHEMMIYVWNAEQTISISPVEARDINFNRIKTVTIKENGSYARFVGHTKCSPGYGLICSGTNAL